MLGLSHYLLTYAGQKCPEAADQISTHDNLTGDPDAAVGIGCLPHTHCLMLLNYLDHDSWDHSVYGLPVVLAAPLSPERKLDELFVDRSIVGNQSRLDAVVKYK